MLYSGIYLFASDREYVSNILEYPVHTLAGLLSIQNEVLHGFIQSLEEIGGKSRVRLLPSVSFLIPN
jgi:hypothetical protein